MSQAEPLYNRTGSGYAKERRPDPRLARPISEALGDARTVLNVGAGTGSYEPQDRYVLAVEPSATMRAQRPPGAAPALDARAEARRARAGGRLHVRPGGAARLAARAPARGPGHRAPALSVDRRRRRRPR